MTQRNLAASDDASATVVSRHCFSLRGR
jgi:hypothetical protein